MNNILNCDLHDYLEIACLYQYQVTITLNSGDKFTGTPKTTAAREEGPNKYEVLIFACDNGDTVDVELLQLKSMQVHTKHAKFTSISF